MLAVLISTGKQGITEVDENAMLEVFGHEPKAEGKMKYEMFLK